ncbi:unnamed protein product, partial [Didymodactylos carnosus]
MGASEQNLLSVTTRSVVSDYIYWRLHNSTNIEIANILTTEPNRINILMRQLANESEIAYRFRSANIFPTDIPIIPANIHATFLDIVENLFSDGICNWGRIIMLISYSGMIALKCYEHNMPAMINLIIEWTEHYIDNDLKQWIDSQKAWDGFGKHFENNRRQSLSRFATIMGTI